MENVKCLKILIILLFAIGISACNIKASDSTIINDDYEETIVSKKSNGDNVEKSVDYEGLDGNIQVPDVGNADFNYYISQNVSLNEGETVTTECIEKDKCYRLRVEYSTEPGKSVHARDYFFVKEEEILSFVVYYDEMNNYNEMERRTFSNCTYNARYEDVSFDGVKDIIVSLGYNGQEEISCAYICTEDGFIYTNSFERIKSFWVDYTKEEILDCYKNRYKCENKKFVLMKDSEVRDPSFLEYINRIVNISEGEEISQMWWLVKDIVYRVAIDQTANPNEYAHTRDYFFILDDAPTWFEVDYPPEKEVGAPRYPWNCCTFEAEYVDVTFDGKRDIVISLGDSGTAGASIFCAYVNKGGEFEYVESFEDIPNYSINIQEKVIEGWVWDGPYYREIKAKYDGDGFVIEKEDLD